MLYPDGVEETPHRILARRIARPRRKGGITGYGNHTDERTPGFKEIWQRVTGAVDRAPEVHVHQPPQHVELHVPEHGPHRNAGIVYQYVYPAELGYSRLHHVAAVLLDGDIRLHTQNSFRIGRH